MKILQISAFRGVDYMNDMVFHGGRETFGLDYEESTYAYFMYKSFLPRKSCAYVRGFSLTCMLDDHDKYNKDEVEQKIANKYYDYIIYGQVFRCRDYLDLVRKVYPKNKVAMVDGEDHTGVYLELLDAGIYFKRELLNPDPTVNPINFSIPEVKFVKEKNKTQKFATVVPGKPETYIFNDEDLYHKDYQKSFFAHTWKKGGWDCMRHQEIVANYCFPFFRDLENCPPRIMPHFPKTQVINYMNKYTDIVSPSYWDVVEEIWQHSKTYLTTKYTIKYILEKLS